MVRISRFDNRAPWLFYALGFQGSGPCVRDAPLRGQPPAINNLKVISLLSLQSLRSVLHPANMPRSHAQDSRSLSYLLTATLCSGILRPCLAADTKFQAPLYHINPSSTLKWEGCGELSNHTLECKQIICTCTGTILKSADHWQVPVSMYRWITSTNHQTRHFRFLSSEC